MRSRGRARTAPLCSASRPAMVLRGAHVGEGQAHGAARLTLECAVHRACIVDEVAPRPWISQKELGGKHVRFQAIAGRTRGDDVARRMRAALGERIHMVERGAGVVELGRAVHASAAAVSNRGELDRPLLLGRDEAPYPAQEAATSAGERDAMTTVSSGQSHLAGKDDTPRREELPVAGCRATCASSAWRRSGQQMRRAPGARIGRCVVPCRAAAAGIGLRVRRGGGITSRCGISAVGVPRAQ